MGTTNTQTPAYVEPLSTTTNPPDVVASPEQIPKQMQENPQTLQQPDADMEKLKLPTTSPADQPYVNPDAQSPKFTTKQHTVGILRNIIDTLSEGLGGPKEVQSYGPHGETTDANGNPLTRTRGTGERILSGIGKEIVGISAGLGAARGPGGVGRAAAAASGAVLDLQEKNRAYDMQMHVQHANDILAYRHQTAESEKDMTKNATEAAGYVNLMKGATSVATPANEGQPLNHEDMLKLFQENLAKGYKVSDMVQFPAPPEKNVPSPSNPMGIGSHPMFYVFQSNQTGGTPLVARHVTVDDEVQAKSMGVAVGTDVPIYLAAKKASEIVTLNNGAGAIKRTLSNAGIDTKDIPNPPSPGTPEAVKDADAMQKLMKQKDWIVGGDLKPAFAELQATDPDAAQRISKYIGEGNVDKLSDHFRRERAKQDAINLDEDKAPASPELRGGLSKEILGFKGLDNGQKAIFTEELSKLPPETSIKRIMDVVNRASNEDFKAIQALNAEKARTQQAADARAARELERQLKEGEEPTADQRRPTVMAVGEGRQEMPGPWVRTPQGRAMMDEVNAEFPNYSQSKYPAYKKMSEDYSAGKSAQAIDAMNVVIKHIGNMWNIVDKHPGSTGLTGRAMGWMNIGDAGSRAQALKVVVDGLSTELSKAYAGGIPTEGQIKEWQKSMQTTDFNETPAKIKERLKEGLELLQGAVTTKSDRWRANMPKHADGTSAAPQTPIMYPESQDILKKTLGRDIDQWGYNAKTSPANTTTPATNTGAALKPGNYVVQNGQYYSVDHPAVKAAIDKGVKFNIVTMGETSLTSSH